MILYFSATGNSKYVAKRLAASSGQSAVSVMSCLKDRAYQLNLEEGEDLGLVFPVYFGGLPHLVSDYLHRVQLNRHPAYTWLVLTYGTTTGGAGAETANILVEKGIGLDLRCGVRMVDTWTPIFDVSDREKNDSVLAEAETMIDAAGDLIVRRQTGNFDRNKLPGFFASLFRLLNRGAFRTRHFRVTEDCIGCGLCSGKCPDRAIAMENGRPVWVKDRCDMCLRCLHRCPRFAIRCGGKSGQHGQYVNPKAK